MSGRALHRIRLGLLLLLSSSLSTLPRTAFGDNYYDDPYYSETGWNETGDGDPYSAYAAAYPGRGLASAYDSDEAPRAWSVSMNGDDGVAGEAGAGAAGGLGGGVGGGAAAAYATPTAAVRRGHAFMGGAAGHAGGMMMGRGGPGGAVAGAGAAGVPGSCPGGVCPNPAMYEEDLHFDPRYPYDNCQYVGSFDTFQLNGTETCHMLVQGVDGHADRLEGGMDGTYLLAGCFEGKPLYMRSRRSGPPGEDRVLYFNPHFGAWEFAVGREPNVDQLVLAGDEGHVSPIDVPRWRLAAAFNAEQAALLPSDDEELYYVAAGVSVMCAGEGDDSLLSPEERKQLRAQRVAAGLEGPEGEDGEGAEEEEEAAGGPGIGRAAEGAEDEAAAGAAAGRGGGKGWGGKKGAKAQQGAGRAGGKAGGRGGAAAAGGRGGRASARGDAAGSAAASVATTLGGRTGRARAVGGDVELEAEVVELREFWQQHEEEFYESRYQYGDAYGGAGYDDMGRQGYDDEYGPYGY
ncbi:hypothetical protein HYH02_004073 [Chlamydomonas schloesseri]|uniref:Uncharacterized protein n=1 Tax=Chlamydomonas schloesseri TaxID=2026947 RepID=A0A836B9L4_9CHLO|nr:hypothetical protein HYH02_004073 [Chlamydomonas schloesseri]|eukprot:KAG2451475.1 hypothetical protein HYH02_004073 [Chlamydomonas schloesseri]